MDKRTAIVAGASGLVGQKLLNQLLADDLYERVILFGRKAIDINHPALEQCIVDFGQLDTVTVPFKIDDVYCTLGTTIKKAGSQQAFRLVDHDYVVNLAKYAIKSGARRFLVVSAMGADARSRIFYNRVKGEMENTVSDLPMSEKHIFRPSLILGKRSEFRLGELFAQKAAVSIAFIFSGPLKKYRPIKAEAIARAMIKAAKSDKAGTTIYPSDQMLEM